MNKELQTCDCGNKEGHRKGCPAMERGKDFDTFLNQQPEKRMSETRQCDECGMPTDANEYHPYTACLIFKQTSSSKAVHANLNAVLADGANRWRSVAEQAEKAEKALKAADEWLEDERGSNAIRSSIGDAISAFDSLRKEQTDD